MKRCIAFILLAFCVLALAACRTSKVSYVEPSEKVLLDAKLYYKQSSLVVLGNCTEVKPEKDENHYTIQISEVIAGEVDSSRAIQVAGKSLNAGNNYLLFLAAIEDSSYYRIVNDSELRITADSVLWNGTWVNLKTVLSELYSFAATITIPGTTYFYTKLSDLTEAADAIFIGEVLDAPKIKKMNVKSQIDGAIVENAVEASVVKVVVYGTIKGNLKYGTTIKLVNIPSTASSMTDSKSLENVSMDTYSIINLANESTYMFFVQKTKDVKQDYYFPLNPIQGWILVDRDFVTVARFNTPLYGYKTLPLLVRDVKSSLVIKE